MLNKNELYLLSQNPLVKVFYDTDIDGTEYWCLWHDEIDFLPDERKWLPLTEEEAECIINDSITNIKKIVNNVVWRGL